MQVYVSNREIEQIAEGLVHVACGKPPPKRIDIDAVAAYLGLTVRYEKFAESDPDKIGFTSDGKSALTVFRNERNKESYFRKKPSSSIVSCSIHAKAAGVDLHWHMKSAIS